VKIPLSCIGPHYTCAEDVESTGEVKLPVIEHHSIKTCGVVNIQLDVYLTSTPDIVIKPHGPVTLPRKNISQYA
jgi:hypothetical protein